MGGQFWAMDSLNLVAEQVNLQGGQMATKLTCYLRP